MRCRIVRDSMGDHRLFIFERATEGGKVKTATGLIWKDREEYGVVNYSDGIGSRDLIQSILNEAWEEGFRPTGFSDIKNETAALRGHLDDLRAVAFHALGIKGTS